MAEELMNRNIPDRLLPRYQEMERVGQGALYDENYVEAEQRFEELYEQMLSWQVELERGIHKGAVLYELGICALGRRHQGTAARRILRAYVEDTLGTPYDYEDNADRAPAARILIDGFVIQLRVLREIKSIAKSEKENPEIFRSAVNPDRFIRRALDSLDIRSGSIISLCENQVLAVGATPLGFPQPRENRVFIGTNYDTHSSLIQTVKAAVIQRHYTPVVVGEVIIPQNSNVHDVSLLLLHTCRYAIIDVTSPAGQFLEIERARDYGVQVLLVRNAPVGHQPHVSAMISSLISNQCQLQTYRDPNHLRRIVLDFLP